MHDICKKCASPNLVSNFGRLAGKPGKWVISACADCGAVQDAEQVPSPVENLISPPPFSFCPNPEEK